ncbi:MULTISPECIES: hypothetical protein [Nitrosomonas]|uniref:hypothetical protein n=1 Tax=Nitrosomonas TaxID=914 RepID=UPI000942AF37|nr:MULTISPECIES: hypothetical protein [Nitrosomonas]MXS79786.1 hypothetical protein [Nitrosomonas sp. GH22]
MNTSPEQSIYKIDFECILYLSTSASQTISNPHQGFPWPVTLLQRINHDEIQWFFRDFSSIAC